jgi:hypothetical protein
MGACTTRATHIYGTPIRVAVAVWEGYYKGTHGTTLHGTRGYFSGALDSNRQQGVKTDCVATA